MTKQQFQEELRQSMLARDAGKTSVLRMLLSAINYSEIQKGGANYEATEDDVLQVLQKEAKQHRESIEQFTNANRNDLADKEKAELKLLEVYLPAQMGEEEIKKLVIEAITQADAKTPADLGKVMSALMPKTKGKADGGLVSKIVREQLSSL